MMLIFYLISFVSCYYKQGHSLIGELTDTLLNPVTKENIGLSIKEISPWADSVRRLPGYRWTKPLHYIDTDDNAEENNCNVTSIKETERNIYTALQNYTQRLSNKSIRTDEDLKFFVHFYEDLFQPLHMSGIYRGGNEYLLTYLGRQTNLHQVWDYLILRDRIQEFDDKADYIEYLLKTSKHIVPYLAFDFKHWIRHNNKINCESVYKELRMNITKPYYEKNKYVVDKLVMLSAINLKFILENLY